MFCVQAEDGRRDLIVTGVQTCALPISPGRDRVPVFTLKHSLEGVVVPSKLYGILAAGKPVLGLAPEWSDVDYIVKEAGCGYIDCPFGGLEDFIEAGRALSNDPERSGERGEAARGAGPG